MIRQRRLFSWVKDKVLPAAREMAEAYIEAVKVSAKEETGWCKARDTLVIPALISCGLWLTEQAGDKVAEQKWETCLMTY